MSDAASEIREEILARRREKLRALMEEYEPSPGISYMQKLRQLAEPHFRPETMDKVIDYIIKRTTENWSASFSGAEEKKPGLTFDAYLQGKLNDPNEGWHDLKVLTEDFATQVEENKNPLKKGRYGSIHASPGIGRR